jgi:hypothetical protein
LPADDETPRGGSQAICVRTCDGGFFPLNYSARHGNLDSLGDLCRALCPNVEVSVFTRDPEKDVGSAVGADGTPYASAENAFRFQKSFDPACTCKPPGQSWAQALADAERVLGQDRKGDIIVTPEKSLEMSRPKIDPVLRAKLLAADPNAADKPPATAADGATPPASGTKSSTSEVLTDQSGTQEVTGPDGVKRHVRQVGPSP